MGFGRRDFTVRSCAALLIYFTALVSSGGPVAQTQPAMQLKAIPTFGSAPLAVEFTGTGSGQFEGVMLLDFGDGHIEDSIPTIRSFERVHTYTAPGTYKVELKSGTYGS
jgi:PKD repeat protein